jgi:hypothetical protein
MINIHASELDYKMGDYLEKEKLASAFLSLTCTSASGLFRLCSSENQAGMVYDQIGVNLELSGGASYDNREVWCNCKIKRH